MKNETERKVASEARLLAIETAIRLIIEQVEALSDGEPFRERSRQRADEVAVWVSERARADLLNPASEEFCLRLLEAMRIHLRDLFDAERSSTDAP
ncbi:hypothetical protein [Aurantimonas sp. 22II-16-19i]|uniref:hypothetical protein n=1 Tax=Aurantimonas sp. 22II-16-19i TaxID=1317114 RepID=UPI0009F7A1B8|nr:hypothetical protein [Aurantimonas sp. 22II-16-19i]ORE93241.1 hypothetical protein ATO4_15860 [Aurantimonas sp. 22II-16-19i]